MELIKSWRWKREGLSHRERFIVPFIYYFNSSSTSLLVSQTFDLPKELADCLGEKERRIEQKEKQPRLFVRQSPISLGTTIWDSSIVLSKYLEQQAVASPESFINKRAIEIGCGCGLPGLLLASLGCKVTLTDLSEVEAVVKENIAFNQLDNYANWDQLDWCETDFSRLSPPFDLIVATDVMYIPESISSLIHTLQALSNENTTILLSFGRNRQALESFEKLCLGKFEVQPISTTSQDEEYRSPEIDIFKLRMLSQETVVEEKSSHASKRNKKKKSINSESNEKEANKDPRPQTNKRQKQRKESE